MSRVICSLLGFSIFFRSTKPPLSPPFHPHSFGERFFARCQLGVLDAVRCCHLISVLAFLFTREVGPGTCRSHLNSAVELGCSVQTLSVPDSSTPLRSSPSGYYATVRTPLHSPTADAAVPPTCVLPPPPLVSCRFSSSCGKFLSPAPQITVFPKGSQNVVRSLHQQRP